MAQECGNCGKTNTRPHCLNEKCGWIVCRICDSFGVPGTDKWHVPNRK